MPARWNRRWSNSPSSASISEQLRGRISTALIYPAIVLLTALFASVFLMTFVVPRILEPMIEQGQPLPFPTRVVKGISDFLLSWGWLVAAIGVVAGASFAALLRQERGKRWWHGLVLKLPIIGDLARKQAIVRIAVILSTLLKSGVVFLRATEIARRTTSNRVLRGPRSVRTSDRGRRGYFRSAQAERRVSADGRADFRPGPAIRPTRRNARSARNRV